MATHPQRPIGEAHDMRKLFKGKFIELPWLKWEGIKISPEGILTLRDLLILPKDLDLMHWKAGVYNRVHGDNSPPLF